MTDSNHRMTRNALTLLENLDIEHPVGLYVYEVCRSFVDQYKTSGSYLLYFIASWTKAAELLSDMGIPSSDVINLLDTVIEGVIQHTDTLKVRVTDVLECRGMFPLSRLPDTHKNRHTDSIPGNIIKANEKQCAKLLNQGVNSDNEIVKRTFEQQHQTEISNIDDEIKTTKDSRTEAKQIVKKDQSTDRETKAPKKLPSTCLDIVKVPNMVDEVLTNIGQTTEVHRTSIVQSGTVNNRQASSTTVPDISMMSALKTEEDRVPDIGYSFTANTKYKDMTPADSSFANDLESSEKELQEIGDLIKRAGVYATVDEEEEFVDGVKIVQLKMENVSEEEDVDGDLSWFFNVDNREESKGEASQGVTTEMSSKNKGPECVVQKHDQLFDVGSYEEMSKSISRLCSGWSSEKSAESGVNNLNGSSDTDVNLENELNVLKACIEMDIRTIKQRQEQLSKAKNKCQTHSQHMQWEDLVYVQGHKPDPPIACAEDEFQSCFDDSAPVKSFNRHKPDPDIACTEDEFDSCFNDSAPINAPESTTVNTSDDISTMEDEFKTINFSFITEHSKVLSQGITKEAGTTHTSCQILQMEAKHETQDTSSSLELKHKTQDTSSSVRNDGLELGVTEMSSMKPESDHGQKNNGHLTKQSDGNVETPQIDEFETDFDSTEHDSKDNSKITLKDFDSTSSVKQTSKTKSAYSTKTRTGTKLQEIDNILKGLGQDLKPPNMKAKTMLVSSRHLAEWNTKDTSEAVSVESNITSTLSNIETNTFENNKVSIDPYEETNDSKTAKKQIVMTDMPAGRETKVAKKLTSASTNVVKTESLGLGNVNELLNSIVSTHGPLSSNKTKSKFQSGIVLRSRHLQSGQDGEEQEADSEVQASGETNGRPTGLGTKTESLGLGNVNELLNSIVSTHGPLSSNKTKSKFQSGIVLRSRHLQSGQDGEEQEADSEVQASGETNGRPTGLGTDTPVRPNILQLVKCLNYGTDHRLLNVITDIVIKHSQDNNICSIQPQYVQTYCISGGQRDPELVDGIVIQTSQSQMIEAHRLHGKPHRLLIVNADIKSAYKHKGYKPMKTTRILTAETFADHVTKKDQWTLDVIEVLKKLNLDMVFARGAISEDFRHVCDAHGVFTMEFVPYKQLSLISEAAEVTMVTYITLATEDNVCLEVFLYPLEIGMNREENGNSTGQSHHAVVVTIATNNPQTVILKNHSETLVHLEEEEFWDCLSRTSSALQTGFLSPGAGQTELAGARFCSEMRDKHLKESCDQQNPEETYSLIHVYDILAQTFSEYARLVQEHYTLVGDTNIDCVYDDYRTKVSGWRSALDAVSTIKCSDFFISTGITEENQHPSDFVL